MKLITLSLASLAAASAFAQINYSASGADSTAIQATVDAFRTDLGPLNANNPGSVGSGRREINWDAVPDASSEPNFLAANFFNGPAAPRARGAVFTGASQFMVSGKATTGHFRFDSINASYANEFQVFSAERLFTSIGTNVYDVEFFIPGSTSRALVRGFGAVFADVDLDNTTKIDFFGADNSLLHSVFATSADKGLSFAGTSFADSVVSRVRITQGNAALGPVDSTGVDVVVADDFIYGEPVPEPGTLVIVATGALVLLKRRLKLRS